MERVSEDRVERKREKRTLLALVYTAMVNADEVWNPGTEGTRSGFSRTVGGNQPIGKSAFFGQLFREGGTCYPQQVSISGRRRK